MRSPTLRAIFLSLALIWTTDLALYMWFGIDTFGMAWYWRVPYAALFMVVSMLLDAEYVHWRKHHPRLDYVRVVYFDKVPRRPYTRRTVVWCGPQDPLSRAKHGDLWIPTVRNEDHPDWSPGRPMW